ncbi:hypothetical protein A3860_33540 [Niastella vici]|uniref:histidine kinase n=1 Tax=Niastella vici TaxID=1703345 RepID=A0A1V9FPZ7_9BACT|nr:histidine kinase dimerization/phosphoacceptor domain -containing protein [Niastella vici]OQP60449.1 hypothetical protein A3860_33540 [Niastella vici]
MKNFRINSILIVCVFVPVYLLAQQETDLNIANDLLRNGNTDTIIVYRLLHLGETFLDKPGSRQQDMDMAFRIADEMQARSRHTNYQRGIGLSNLLRAKAFRESGRAGEGRRSSEEALRLLSVYGSKNEQAQAILELGGTYSNDAADMPRKIELYQQGAEYYLKSGDFLSAAKLKEFIGDMLQLHQEYRRALEVLQEALSLYNKMGYQRLHGIYSVFGQTYQGDNNFAQSLRYNLLALETGEKLGEQGPLMATIYNRVALSYYSVKYYDQAVDYFSKALAHARHDYDTATMRTELLNLADALRYKGEYKRSLDALRLVEKLGPVTEEYQVMQLHASYLKNYIALNALNKALPHFEKLKHFLVKGSSNDNANQMVRLAIILYLQSTGRFRETVKYVQDFERVVNHVPLSLNRITEGELYAFRTDSALGNLQQALSHFQRYKHLSDSITSINREKQLGILRLQFETERKDERIELLTQKSKLQEVSLQKGRVFRNVMIAGGCMLLLILALVYNRYRLKKKTTFRLQKQQQEINAQNETLKKLLGEKEWLLKEIHHRVKNNLQVIISLLNTQSQYLDNADAIAAIKNSQHRMYAMSLIHQRLYHTDNLGAIDMNWYIRELTGFIQESFDTGPGITFRISSETILLDVVQAIPLGLILNEAVSNSIKYAFPDKRKGTIEIMFSKDKDGYCLLSISDNGIGFGNNNVPEDAASLGMSLMKGLSEQLDASYDVQSSPEGVTIHLRFFARCFNNVN